MGLCYNRRRDFPLRQTNAVIQMDIPRAKCVVIAILVGLAASPLRAEIGDPTIRTDHPHYPGEGALQTIEQCVAQATAGRDSPQDKAIALFQWLLTHQFHLASPQEWNVPGRTPGANPNDYDMVVYDANRARFSYGYGLCGTVHAWNEPYWKALGMNARRRAFPGHVNSEVEYDGSWHAFDTDMAGLLFRGDGAVAGYGDLMRDPTLAVRGRREPLPCYPFAWPGDFDVMRQGWQRVAEGGDWYKMYNGGYAAQPGIVHLRAGETFTRYFNRDHFGGPDKRRFWHQQKGGPLRNWTFVNQGSPEHREGKSNGRGNASYGNAEFVYRPDLTTDGYREGIVSQSDNAAARSASPHLHARDGRQAQVIFAHFSPYVICGDPADDANPMTGDASGGLVVAGRAAGEVELELSTNGGQSWLTIGQVTDAFELDLTDRVKGHYGWQLRFRWNDQAGVDELRFTTVTQMAQAIYPRLKPNGSRVVYRAASRGVAPVSPDFGLEESAIAGLEETSLRSANIHYQPRSATSRLAYAVRGNKPATVAFRLAAPRPLVAISAAVRYPIRVPPPAGAKFSLETSIDQGMSWQPLAAAEVESDNAYSSGWLYGTADIGADEVRTALVRVHLDGGGTQTGLIAAELYGVYRTPPPKSATLTYAWREGDRLKTHLEQLPSGAREHAFSVPTGAAIVDEYVRIDVPQN
jgi:hypothetical protein